MIRITARAQDGRTIMLLGLSAENIRRLQVGEPIRFSMNDLGFDGECVIWAGHTEQAMFDELRAEGFLPAADASGATQ